MAQRASRVHPVTSKEAHSQIAQLLDLHRRWAPYGNPRLQKLSSMNL